MSRDTEAEATAPPKYARYRSVRRAAAKGSPPVATTTPAAPTAAPATEKSETIKRSMSRYHRPKTALKEQPSLTLPIPAVPQTPHVIPQAAPSSTHTTNLTRQATDPRSADQNHAARHGGEERHISERLRETESERLQREANEIYNQEELRHKAQIQQEEKQRALMQAAEEKLAEQKRKDLERLEATLDAAIQDPTIPRRTTPTKEKFSFFSRKREQNKTTPLTTSASAGKTSISLTRSRGSNDAPVKNNEAPPLRPVDHSGGPVPGADAPVSAVNFGERRVSIRHLQSSINLPVNPETTPVDIIQNAANMLSHKIFPSSTVLLESYTKLGLERRLRRYEHVRDIMNSWDRDTQNSLFLQTSDSPESDPDLDLASVPRDAPADVTVYMYHSQKPGRWNKCHITLLSSGQIFMAKKAGANISDKESVSLCHLSDFDIYIPTVSQLRKLKPPKKHCYAVKSQQKPAMFLSTENFVHFFSADDEALIEKWYAAVQRWRSWYLVHKMGAGEKRGKKAVGVSARPVTRGEPAQRSTNATDDSPYLIGSFEPLFDTEAGHANSDKFNEYLAEAETRPSQAPLHLRNGSRASSAITRRETNRRHPPVSYRMTPEAEDQFAPSSLLGRTYSQRVKAQKEREAQQLQNSGPFTEGPSLLNREYEHRRSLSQRSSLSKRPDTSTSRGSGNGPKPLLDFTPQFKEALQWDKAGKGRGVMPPSGVPLVQLATTPDAGAVELPRTTLFSRDGGMGRPATSGGPGAYGAANSRSIMNRWREN